jgi:hypothetical protein
MTAVYFERRGTIYAVTLGLYDPMAVEVIKAAVPSFARRWSPPLREWFIDEVYGQRLAAALRRINCTIIGLDDDHAQRCYGSDSAEWAREVFHRVGPSRAPLAYRLLSKLCHPDHGGDHELQLELNQAYAELPTERRTA